MDRAEALTLLHSGPGGVAEWNRRREVAEWNRRRGESEEIPELSDAPLSETNLIGADLLGLNFSGANFYKAKLQRTNLSQANLSKAKLQLAELDEADLSGADLRGADLTGAHLLGTDLSVAKLSEANLTGANLSKARLITADLSGANLSGAWLKAATLVETKLTGANLTGCHVYGVSAWKVELDKTTRQSNLVITDDPPHITVDDLEVAQFIHLLLTNRKIRNVVDSVTSKAVLILGRFSERQKPVLDALHIALRDSYNLVPILFDWEPSENRDLTETVLLLANMCRFVIADVTDAKSIPQELSLIVPNVPSLPVQPIILASEHEYAMFEHWRKFPAVLPEYRYENKQQLLDTLDTRVLAPIRHWEEATDKAAAKERQMREEIEAQRAEIAKLNGLLTERRGGMWTTIARALKIHGVLGPHDDR